MMYITLAACLLSSSLAVDSGEAFGADDINLLQTRLTQQSVAGQHSGGTGAASAAYTKAVKGKGGKGKEGETCEAAVDFCSMVTDQIKGCQDFWRTNGGSCSNAFCSVTDAMQLYEGEKAVLEHEYQDATALRRACKTFVKGRTWGAEGAPASERLQCPGESARADACALPSTAENVETLKMATFCDELEFMCDAWAMWFIAAAEDQVSGANESKYSCSVFASWNAYTWQLAPGGCASGDSFGELSAGTAPTDSTGATANFEWTDEYEVRLYGNATTMQWEVISEQNGCEQSGDSAKMKPDAVLTVSGTSRQGCFEECQRHRWCMAVDWVNATVNGESGGDCTLFNWACEAPASAGVESWRLHRSDSGVSWTGGGRMDCDLTMNDVMQGAGDKWSCPSYVAEYEETSHGCLLPDGPLATCVCAHEAGCGSVETVYDDNFQTKFPNRKRLSTGALKNQDASYSCKKKAGSLLQEAVLARAEKAAEKDQAEVDYGVLLDVSLSRKACVESC